MDIRAEKVTYEYMPGTPFAHCALRDISITIPSKSYTAIIGQTGSGKSTLVQHFNGLLTPTKGEIIVGDRTIYSTKKNKHLKELRQKVGLVFQYPEHQLFEETVEKDICFGPLNFGVPIEKAKKRARIWLHRVGLSDDFLDRSPFELSGGQMRRVAIAGVLAMDPEVLIVDEPTAGLDPKGRKDMMELFSMLNKEHGKTVILVTHNMLDAALFADQIIVMKDGMVTANGSPTEIFKQREKLIELGLDLPGPVQFLYALSQRLNQEMPPVAFSVKEVAEQVTAMLHKERLT
ncbi:energy-coupling factor ABC transporter ATP-binding protein [Alkalihalobacillus sp. LMS39]|uniref:energy-coupling factor ABC transporter ATP-binding protein n=1 Tax=Alkalihalobacillus sp. LMS39 TaxID=2924032 RepID=UPI001FB2F0D8|nr:energy-coupling factor ABC transporter ATP-binding protein [Alkalihalobacillus sp. LMS39]UOE94281.1 energy-coupling factor ABC transporter ATP-binding protein [Alkalihalobacillus sp. LMS39]